MTPEEREQIDLAAMFSVAPEVVQPTIAPTVAARMAAEQRRKSKNGARIANPIKLIKGRHCDGCGRSYDPTLMIMAGTRCVFCWDAQDKQELWLKFWEQYFGAAVRYSNYSCSTRSSAYRALQMVQWAMDECPPGAVVAMLLTAGAGLREVRSIRHKAELHQWRQMVVAHLVKLLNIARLPPEEDTQLRLF